MSTKTAQDKLFVGRKAPGFTLTYLWLIAFITVGLGVGLLLLPAWVAGLFFGSPGSDQVTFFARMVGSTLIGYGALNALAAQDGTRSVCKTAVWSNLVTLLIASVVTLTYQSVFEGFGWLIISQHILFAVGFIYCAQQIARTEP